LLLQLPWHHCRQYLTWYAMLCTQNATFVLLNCPFGWY